MRDSSCIGYLGQGKPRFPSVYRCLSGFIQDGSCKRAKSRGKNPGGRRLI